MSGAGSSAPALPGGLSFDWTADPAFSGACPNCGAPAPGPRLVLVRWTDTKTMRPVERALYACATCDARFYEPRSLPEYHHEETRVIGWPPFHVQQNAGIWPITAPIARIDKPARARCLEIGGGYGFGLDFAIHERGWNGLGIDPAPLAGLGRRDLDLPVRIGYFPKEDTRTAALWDVIVATEVIEHMDHPGILLTNMRDRIAPDGIVLLTTPDGGAIAPDTPHDALEQILVPEIHTVFQTEASMAYTLRAAGFTHLLVERDATSLVAFASTAPFVLEDDPPTLRARFRRYLDRRAASLDPVSDAGIGLLGRALFEATNDGDHEAADAARTALFPALRSRYGLDPETLEDLPPPNAAPILKDLVDVMPFNLGPVMFAEAMRRIGAGAPRSAVLREFHIAGQACDTLLDALHRLWLTDALTAEIAWHVRAEQAICRATMGDAEAAALVLALPSRGPGDLAGPTALWRVLIELTNAGAIAAARDLVARAGLDWPEPGLPPGIATDALRIIGQLGLLEGGDPAAALPAAAALDGDDPFAAELLLGAVVRLVNMRRFDEIVPQLGHAVAVCAGREDALGTDAANALAIAIDRTADPAAIPGLIRSLRLDGARRVTILLDAFSRLVAAERYDEAMEMVDAENIVSHAVARDDESGQDARLALALLDLATGDPMDVPARIDGLAIEEVRRREILIGAFSRLVNAARYADAARFAAEVAIEALAGIGGADDAPGNDALVGLAILDLVIGDPARAPGRIAGIPIESGHRRQITLGAFVALVNRARYDDAIALRDNAPVTDWAAIDDADGADAAVALVALALITEDPAGLPALLGRLPHVAAAAHNDALVQAALRLLHLARPDEAEAIIARIDTAALAPAALVELLAAQAGCAAAAGDIAALDILLDRLEAAATDPSRIASLAVGAFVTAVNNGDFAAARPLCRWIEPAFANYAPATTELTRSAGFALGILELQDPPQPHRAERAFAAVRRGFAAELAEGTAAPALFWEALRGEFLALHRTGRAAEAIALGRAMLARYEGAPADLRNELIPPAQ